MIKQEGHRDLCYPRSFFCSQIADHIVVLYAGETQEYGTAEQVVNPPTHDYTRRLMHAVRPPLPQAREMRRLVSINEMRRL
ncbi:MAG: hypothetical protein Ct9H300mP13_3380 [Gammaproteobacteria bacterium]|nr:MAG: hypothetical protein Ct9H300mP13_3380 [Gammaproteobacteria bacterium]